MSIPEELYSGKFVEYIETIKILYLCDDKFKNLCDQYCGAAKKSKKYQKKFEHFFHSKLKSDNLSKELEEEILFYMIRNMHYEKND
ncbi:hypothetical protein SAMN05444397_11819 [Flavobacterium aquidurense]|uniref:Uncharacterized protein n=1 Tax=Flavobacterium frigidimaris TaxID=262320 RepID=A0ABX4BM22_FLAFR|nr:hypothetical protein [Flavobacterium frigidimaris]MBJ2127293.1 hypothetical protein [Flavobacterium sp. IB48]OXA76544.1 hypothetical protein B0A65_18710 [Flavobacterium frigidimaris]SDZ66919.1 hypothetical protein SAMN05444397_11819 [Flavobacterium aquidurense]